MAEPVYQVACDAFKRHDAAIGRLAEAMKRARTELGRRELATAMCVKANELLNCRRRSRRKPHCAVCRGVVSARRDAVAQFILACGAPIDPFAAMPPTGTRRGSPKARRVAALTV